MELGHLRDVNVYRLRRNVRVLELGRVLDVKHRFLPVRRVQRTLELNDRHRGVFNELNLADPAAVLVSSQFFVDLLELQVTAVENVMRSLAVSHVILIVGPGGADH